jgi:uncharacterized membrane protein
MAKEQIDLNEQVVVAFFPTAEAADAAAEALMQWDKASDEIKLGTMGRLTQKDDGKLESKRYGKSSTKKGALIGGAVGLLAGVATGGLSLLGGALVGGALGGGAGSLAKGSLGLTESAMDDIKQRLQAGGAALVVLVDDFEMEPTFEELKKAGGEVQSYGVSAKVLQALSEVKVEQLHETMQVQSAGQSMATTGLGE